MFLKFFSKKPEKNNASQNDRVIVHGVDREMNYCPACGDEYRADVSHCGTCDIPLISGREKLERVWKSRKLLLERSMEIGPGDELVNGPQRAAKGHEIPARSIPG